MKTLILCVFAVGFAANACQSDDRAAAGSTGGRESRTGGDTGSAGDTPGVTGGRPSNAGGAGGTTTGTGGDAKCGGEFFRVGEGGTPPGVIVVPTGGRLQLPLGGRATGGAECSRGVVRYEYPPDPAPATCETCGCTPAAADDCDPVDCVKGAPVYPCTDADMEEVPPAYELEAWPRFLASRVLEIKLQMGGGCERHAVSLCFDPRFIESDPVRATLRLRHEVTGDQRCEALKYQTVRFSLEPLLDYYSAVYATNTGVIATNYGLFGFGNYTCSERSRIAYDQVQRVTAAADRSCQTDADCAAVTTRTACSGGVDAAVSSSAAEPLQEEVWRISALVCEDFCYFEELDACKFAAVRCEAGACKGVEREQKD